MEVLIANVVSFAIGVVAVVFPIAWALARRKLKQLINCVEQFKDVLIKVDQALEDEKVTKEEVKQIWKEIKEMFSACEKLYR